MFVIFLQEDKVRKGKKNRTGHEKRHNFLIRGIMFLSANVPTTFSPNFSQFGPGVADLELEMHVQLFYFLLSRNSEKIKFGGIQVLRDYHTRGDTAEESTFYLTIGL